MLAPTCDMEMEDGKPRGPREEDDDGGKERGQVA